MKASNTESPTRQEQSIVREAAQRSTRAASLRLHHRQMIPCQLSVKCLTSPDGEIGRRSGLKIRSPSMGVGVQVPLRAPVESTIWTVALLPAPVRVRS